jgi:hypothetical protein
MLETFEEAHKLLRRAQDNEAFRRYLARRAQFLIPVGIAMLVSGIALAAGTVVFLGGTSPLLVLPAILLVPVVLAGSVFIQLYLFGSWLELRALARALGRSAGRPGVPWALVAGLLAVPFAMLAIVSWQTALGVVVLTAGAPFLYAYLEDRRDAKAEPRPPAKRDATYPR